MTAAVQPDALGAPALWHTGEFDVVPKNELIESTVRFITVAACHTAAVAKKNNVPVRRSRVVGSGRKNPSHSMMILFVLLRARGAVARCGAAGIACEQQLWSVNWVNTIVIYLYRIITEMMS